MKAIICPRYGSPDVLQLREVENPVPQEDEVLIRIHAASINSRDLRIMRANPFMMRFMPGGFFRPRIKILGADFAGEVVGTGKDISQFQPGDEVFGYMPSATRRGTLAEYVCANKKLVTLKPTMLTFEQAAAVPLAAMVALQALRSKGNLQPGQKVLIYGASGGVGTFAVQIAKALRAEVTAVCSTRNLDLIRSLGAEHVINYKVEDFTHTGRQYDLILAVNGYRSIADYLSVLKPGGSCIVAGGSLRQMIQAGIQGRQAAKSGDKKIHILSLEQNQPDMIFLKELLQTGKVAPVIDVIYPMSRTADAFHYCEKEHPRGKVVITISEQEKPNHG